MATARLTDPVDIGPVHVGNRLYRAPVLEVAGNRPDAAHILQRELTPSAEGGCGLVFQGASLVTPEGGRTAPGLSRIHDRDFVLGLKPAVDDVHRHGGRIFIQLGHGGLQTMEAWHAEYRRRHPDLATYAVSPPPWWFRGLMAAGFLRYHEVRIFTEDELHDLAKAFGRAAGHCFDAGYDGIHLAGANASIFQQLWSPVFNKRTDRYGGTTLWDRGEFLRDVIGEIRRATRPDYPIALKVPAETAGPWFVRHRLTLADGVEVARIAQDAGVDAVVPVQVGVTRDQTVARGKFPKRAWDDPRWRDAYAATFGSRRKARIVRLANRLAARIWPFEATWNAAFAAKVKEAVPDVVVMCEGGIRGRREVDHLLGSGACDMVGFARPFYAEPYFARRLLREDAAEALCANCNNCTIPQVTGATGVCRTPEVLAERGRLQKAGAYREK